MKTPVKLIKQRKCTIYNSVRGEKEYKMSIIDILQQVGEHCKEHVDHLRSLEYHSEEQKKYKQLFPCWIPAGVMKTGCQSDSDIDIYSNVLAIDIDKCDNEDQDFDQIRKKLYSLPYVFAALKSISGEGIYLLVLVEDGCKTINYYRQLALVFKRLYNINIDPHCKNIARKRFISYEEDINNWIKDDDTLIQEWSTEYVEIPHTNQQSSETHSSIVTRRDIRKKKTKEEDDLLTRKAIWLVLENGYNLTTYGAWWHYGNEFKLFEDGYDMFVRLSQNYTLRSDSLDVIEEKWKQCKAVTNRDDVSRKWRGMAKRYFGCNWWTRETSRRLK